MPRYEIPVVFDTEADPPELLGVYLGTEEDTILYRSPNTALVSYPARHAPTACVKVVSCVVTVP